MRGKVGVVVMLGLLACQKNASKETTDFTNHGAAGQQCYPNGTCNDGLVCRDQVCDEPPAGSEGQACYPNGRCDEGLVCKESTCKADALAALVAMADRSCECADKACAEAGLAEFVRFVRANKNAHGDQDVANAAGQRMGKCLIEKGIDPDVLMSELNAAMDEPGDGSLPAPAISRFQTGIEECDRYVAKVIKYLECEKIPPKAREATRKGLESMKKEWADMPGLSKEAKKAAGDACKTALDALEKGSAALGCPL